MLEEDTAETAFPRRRVRDTLSAFAAFVIYAAASVAIWGGSATMHLGTYYIPRQDSADSYLFRWALEWLPWALTHGRDPLASDAIFAPTGASLTWVTTVPGPAFVMWPVTSAFGSLVSLNVLTLLAPALDGWAAFLLCRRLTRSFWASLAGGVFFGFSAFVAHQMNHPNLSLAFPIPILVYLTVRRLEDSLRRWAYLGLMSLALVALWSTSLELFATATMFGGIALAITFLIGREDRAKLWSTTLQIGVAFIITIAVIFVPYLLPALRIAPHGVMRVKDRTSDVLRLVFPEEPRIVGGSWLDALGDQYAGLAYLGIGALAVVVGFAITEWRHRYARGILAFVGIGVLFALGPILMVAQHRLIPLPTAALRPLPLLQQAIPSRMMVYVHLAVAVIVAMWLAAPGGRFIWARWAIVIAAAASLVPAIPSPPWHVPDTTPAFFTDGTYRSVIAPSETVLLIPKKGGQQMAWQATTDFWFRMPNGHVGITRQGIPEDPYMSKLQAAGRDLPQSGDELRTWLDEHGVTAIVVEDAVVSHFDEMLLAAGYAPVEQSGGVSVWRPP
ncbi:MAG: hypothetical protein ACJ76A_03870 [Actinomycetota bacterium]|jgi:hypothetical protein